MQKSITSFFGAPKAGGSTVPSPKKAAKTKAKPRAQRDKVNGSPGGKQLKRTEKENPPIPKRPQEHGENQEGKDMSKDKSKHSSPVKRKKEQEPEQMEMMKDASKGAEDDSEDEEAHPQKKQKRLRRLAKAAVLEDSDDDVFGDDMSGDEKPPKSSAIDADTSDTAKSDTGCEGKSKKSKFTPAPSSTSNSPVKGKETGVSPKSPENGEKTSSSPGSRGKKRKANGVSDANETSRTKNEDDKQDDAENETDSAEDDNEDDGEDEDDDDNQKSDGEETVSSALMTAAKKAPASTTKKKAAKGAKAVGVVMEKTEDLLAKASWKNGQPVPFQAVADVFHRVEQTTKRLEIQEIMRGFICTVISLTPEDLVPCIYLTCNEVAPAYERLELGIGDAVLQKAIQGATGRSAKDVKAAAQKTGDLGEVAQHSTKAQGTLSFGQTIKSLSARQILEAYRGIARVKGSSSQEDKINRIKKLLVSCKGLQAKYIIRGLQGKMRIGLSVPTVMVSLSHAAVTCPSKAVLAAEKVEKEEIDKKAAEKSVEGSPQEAENGSGEEKGRKNIERDDKKATELTEKECENDGDVGVKSTPESTPDGARQDADEDGELIPVAKKLRVAKDMDLRLELATQLVKQAYSECPNLDLVIAAILTSPLYRLQQLCRLRPGVPVSPMLAKPTKSIGEVLQRLSGQEFTCEYKYDGVRAQVHLLPDGNLRFFSRNSKDSSSELPDLIPVMKECANEGLGSYVIDTEVVAYDRETGNLLPFQMLSTRGRKDVDATDVKVKVIVEAFDILYLNGKSLLQLPLVERRKALRESFKEVNGRFRFATYMDHKEDGDTEPIEEFLSEAVKGNCEGLMVKTLADNASYEPSKRSLNWLKLKKDYLQADGEGVGDSLDLVPIGAFIGRGKRAGKYGAYLLACYDPEREEYQSVCKIGTGFTDEVLLAFWTELKEHTVDARPRYYNVADTLEPDVWLAPHKVWEVKCADLSKSPVHKAAIGKIDPDRGISIRFPRLLREREDKDPEQATTSDQILDMYENQDVIKNNATGSRPANADDDWEL